jgi:hypothetical protein
LVGWRVQGCCDRLDRLDQHAVRVGDDVCVEEPVRPTCVETRGDQRGDVSSNKPGAGGGGGSGVGVVSCKVRRVMCSCVSDTPP